MGPPAAAFGGDVLEKPWCSPELGLVPPKRRSTSRRVIFKQLRSPRICRTSAGRRCCPPSGWGLTLRFRRGRKENHCSSSCARDLLIRRLLSATRCAPVLDRALVHPVPVGGLQRGGLRRCQQALDGIEAKAVNCGGGELAHLLPEDVQIPPGAQRDDIIGQGVSPAIYSPEGRW